MITNRHKSTLHSKRVHTDEPPQVRFAGEWEDVQLKQAAFCLDNLRQPMNQTLRASRSGPYPYCGANGIVDYIDDYCLDEDIILIAEDGGHFEEYVHRPIAYRISGKVWVNNHAHILRAKPGCDQGYLFYSLVHKNILPHLANGTRHKLNKTDMYKIVISLPIDTAEQQAIARALSDVDDLLGGLDALIAKKQDVKRAAMQQLLSGNTRLAGFGGEWEGNEVRNIGFLYGGLTGKTKGDFGQGRARYVTFLSILEDTILNAKHTDYVHVAPGEAQNAVLKGDLLFNGTSETPDDLAMGAVMGVEIEHLYLNSFCFGLRIRDKRQYDPLFLAYLFRSPTGRTNLKALAQGATRYNLSKGQFLKLHLSVPSLSEQQAIAHILSDMDAEIAALESQRDKMLNIKQGMMQQLLSGKVRLPKTE